MLEPDPEAAIARVRQRYDPRRQVHLDALGPLPLTMQRVAAPSSGSSEAEAAAGAPEGEEQWTVEIKNAS